MKNIIMYFLVFLPIFFSCKRWEESKLYSTVPGWKECYKNENEAQKRFMNFPISNNKKEFVQGVGVLNCKGVHKIFVFYEEENKWEEIILPPDLQKYFVRKIEFNNSGFNATFFGVRVEDNIYFYSYLTRKWTMVKKENPPKLDSQKVVDLDKRFSPTRAFFIITKLS